MDPDRQFPSAPLVSQPLSSQALPEVSPPTPPAPRSSRLNRLRALTSSRMRRVLLACIFFLFGLLCGIVGIFVLLFIANTDNAVVANPLPPATNDIVVQVGATYITHLVSNALQSSGLPGTIQNVQVTFTSSDQATITGADQISVLGVGTTRHFTIIIQPYVSSCRVNVHVLHADLGGIAVTGFASAFEGQVDSQIQVNPSKLPGGFTYCTTSVRTDPQGVFVTYSAKPVSQSSPSTSLRRREKNAFM
jgi:hypothetical protein